MNIKDFFQNYKVNKEIYDEIDKRLLNLDNKEQWFDLITDRSIMQSQLYIENKRAIDGYFAYIDDHGSGGFFAPEEADELYSFILDMYYNDYDDYEIIIKAVNPLIKYYKREKDYSKLVLLYSIKNYEMVEFWSRQSENPSIELVLSDALEAISYKVFYNELDAEAKRKIIANYYNIVNVNLGKVNDNINISYYYLTEALNYWNSPLLTDEDRADERSASIMDKIAEEWLGSYDVVDQAPPVIQEYFMNLSDEIYGKYMAQEGSMEKISHEIVFSHYETLLLRNQLDPLKAFDELIDYYKKRKQYLESLQITSSNRMVDMSFEYMDYLYFFINLPLTVLSWIECHKIPEEIYKPHMSIFLEDLHARWDELYQNLPGPFLDNYIMEICLTLIPHSGNNQEQEEWLKKLLLKRHLPTFIHINMVANMAVTIARELIDKSPSVIAVKDFPAETLKDREEEFLKFIEEAALFHDLGKSRIGDIVSQQTRPITRDEFGIIKSHPTFGAQYIEKAQFLSKYKDVILGHHKFYDGSGGYPMDYDNTRSPYRAVVDLITICDCLDAATDFLSRNYSFAKSIDEVYKELYAGKGSRYNPYIAEFMFNDKDLKDKLRYITGEGRIQKYYEIYEEYLSH